MAIGPRIGSKFGARFAPAFGGDPISAGSSASWTVDAASGKAFPANATEWSAFIAARGLVTTVPSALWNFQETTGNFADSIGAFPLTAGVSLGYQNAVAGFTRKSIAFVDGSATSAATTTSASLPDISVTSMLVLGIWLLNTPSVAHDFYEIGTTTTQRGIMTIAPVMKIASGSNNATGVTNPTGSVRPFVFQSNHTTATAKLITSLETLSAALGLATGKSLMFGGSAVGSCGGQCLYGAMWQGAAAELAATDIAALTTAMGF